MTPICPQCKGPAHAAESDDKNVHARCQAAYYKRTGRADPLAGDLTVDEYGAIFDFLQRKKMLPYVSLVSSGFLYGGQVVSSVAEAKRVFGYKPPRKR